MMIARIANIAYADAGAEPDDVADVGVDVADADDDTADVVDVADADDVIDADTNSPGALLLLAIPLFLLYLRFPLLPPTESTGAG